MSFLFDWFERLGSVEPNKVLRLFQSSERLYQFLPQCFGLLRLEQGAAGLCDVCPADGVDEPTQRFGQGDAYVQVRDLGTVPRDDGRGSFAA